MWTKQQLYGGLIFFFNGIMGWLLVSLTYSLTVRFIQLLAGSWRRNQFQNEDIIMQSG